MSEKTLRLFIGFFIGLFILSFLFDKKRETYYGDINIAAMSADAAEGLDLKAVGELLKQAKDAEEFESLLNKPGGVNNLDLNGDGKVDYIQVTEYGDKNAKGFSLTTQPAKGETQEIAAIEIEKSPSGDTADINIQGNRNIYGSNYYYRDSHFLRDMLIFSYLFRPHPFYYSPYGFGYYPGWYGGGYRTVSRAQYRSAARNYTRSSTARKSSSINKRSNISSPNKGKTAARGIRSSLRNPTRSQRSFQTRERSRVAKARRSGGFGRSSRRATRPSTRFGGFGRSGGFGFGK